MNYLQQQAVIKRAELEQARLTGEFSGWKRAHRIGPLATVDTLLRENYGLTQGERTWLSDFRDRWEATMIMRDCNGNVWQRRDEVGHPDRGVVR